MVEAVSLPAGAGPYQVNLMVFQGPLDLLLQLVEQRKLDITTISLAQVADQYVEYIGRMPEHDPEVLSGFLVVAAKLLLLKSWALLPRPPQETAEEEGDPGEELARQLLEYKRFKEAAAHLRAWEERGERSYVRIAPPPKVVGELRLEGVTLADLAQAVRRALATMPGQEPGRLVLPEIFSIDDKMGLIESLLDGQGEVAFSSLLSAAASKLEVIVTFLALLELLKQGRAFAYQHCVFGEIRIARAEGDAVEASLPGPALAS
ncbi:MAG: segregation/condensation protein A [Chloroflexota bacterium]